MTDQNSRLCKCGHTIYPDAQCVDIVYWDAIEAILAKYLKKE